MKSRRIPAYTHHKPTGQARVRINSKSFYLGKYGSPESHDRYDSLIAVLVIDSEPASFKTLTTVLAAWWAECQRRYTKGKGKLGGAQNWRPIIRLLRTHHGDERTEDLGPVKLRKLLEAEGEREGWSLTYTRMQLARVKQIFKWAASEELVGITAYQRLQVCEIRNGRKSKPIPPVADSVVAATLPCLKRIVADMVCFQRLTGIRPGELVAMQRDLIDRSGEIWIYTPVSHKTEHHGKTRTIYIGPKAQAILTPWLLKAVDGCCMVWTWRKGEPYSTDSYRRAVHRAVERLNAKRLKDNPQAELLPKWAPNQIRKAAATSIRAALDVEHAAAVLGHSSSVVTGEHYAAANRERAIEAVKLLG